MKLSGWPVVLVVISSVLFAQTNGDFSSGANQAVRCMLAHHTPDDCASLPKVRVPSYLLQVYDDSPPSLHESLRQTTLNHLSEDQVANIPLTLLYLIPRARLADLNSNQLRAILQEHAEDTSLVHQVASSIHHGNNMFKLIEKMKNVSLPWESQQILAESVQITDLTETFLALPFVEKEPLLAYLRPAVLFKVDKPTLRSIFILLQMTALFKPPNKSASYFLTEAAVRHKIPLSTFNNFVLGLSPDQLLNENLSYDNSVHSFKLDLSLMQARALFEQTYQSHSLNSSNFIDSKPVLFKLSPGLLQKFPSNVQKYDANYIDQSVSIPLPTACQIIEYIKADCILAGRLPKNEDEFWDIQIRHLGKWVYTLPLSALEGYKTTVLSTAVLRTLESPAISSMQAYYLSGKGEAFDVMTPNSVLELETFLHALPASQLVNRKLGEISSHVLLHLVSKLPASNLARTLSLVNKIASSLGDITGDTADDFTDDITSDSSVLEELLENRDVNQIMTLLSPKDLDLSAEAMLKMFAENRIRSLFGETIKQLPQQILAALLEQVRLKNPSQWRWSSFLESSRVSHFLVGGLTCQHIEDMDTGLFIPIISHYNAVRKKNFPKNLQHCCLQKLINHLKLKMSLTQADPNVGLISLLEPIEIESVGGYVLVNLPLDVIQVSPYLGHILSNIGRLSSAELMSSSDINQLKLIAELAVDKERNVNTFLVRNLVWFLPPNAITPELRLVLEAQLVNTTICLPAVERRHIATRLMNEFGPLEQWSAGVLAALQDLLIVFSDEELSKISQSSWTKAADSFTSHYDDIVEWMEPSAFYKVCANILGKSEENEYKSAIGRYIHWRLKAAQWLLDTVVPVPQHEVLKPDHVHSNFLNQEEEHKTTLSVFAPEVETETNSEEADESDYESNEEEKRGENTSTRKYEETTTVNSAMKEIPTEEYTTESHSTIRSTTESRSTARSTTESRSTARSTTESRSTERSTTENSSTEKSTTEETLIKKTTNEGSFSVKIAEERTTEKYSSHDKNITHQNVHEYVMTLSSNTQENTSTEKSFEDIGRNHTTNTTINGTIGESKFTNLNITTQSPDTLNITSTTSIKNNYISQEKNFSTEISESSNENTAETENLDPCADPVNKENCRNTTDNSLKSNSTENVTISMKNSTETPIKKYYKPVKILAHEITNSSHDTSSQIAPKTTTSFFNQTNSSSFENQLDFSSFITSTRGPYNMSLNQLEVSEYVSTVTPSTVENQYEENSFMPSSKQTPNNETSKTEYGSKSPLSTDKSNSTSIQNLKKNHTSDLNSPNSNIITTQIPEHQSSNEGYIASGEEEEEIIVDNQYGLLMDPTGRQKRSIFTKPSSDLKLSCNAVKMVGSLVELALTTSDLEKMSDIDIADCRMEFGAMELSESVQKIIWKRIKNDLKLDGIHLLGRLLRVASAADLWDIRFDASEPWILETIHAFIRNNNNTTVMKKLMADVTKRNAEFSVDLLAVLGPAICSLEPDSLRALSVIGLDLGPTCPSCLPYLALRAIQELGNVNSWTLHFVHSLQAIVAGLELDSWMKLAASYHKPLTGLQPSAAKCLNTSHLEVLSPDQIRMIPAVTLLSLSDHQLAAFNTTQLEAVKNITHPTVTENMTPTKRISIAGFSHRVDPTILLLIFISVLHYLKYH